MLPNLMLEHLVLQRIIFFLYGFVQEQDWCVWGMENQYAVVSPSLHSPKSRFGSLFTPKRLSEPFLDTKRLINQNIGAFSTNMWQFKILWRTLGTIRGLCIDSCSVQFSQRTSNDRVIEQSIRKVTCLFARFETMHLYIFFFVNTSNFGFTLIH